MARKARKAAPAASPDRQVGSIFDYLGLPPDPNDPVKVQKTEPAPDAQSAAQVKALQDQVSALTAQISRMSAVQGSVAPAQGPAPIDPRMLQVSMDGLPDPAEDKDEYNRQLGLRINAANAARDAWLQQQIAQQQQASDLGSMLQRAFDEKYPEWSEYGKLVETVAQEVAMDLKTRGVDPSHYMRVSTEQYIDDVAKKLEANYGRLIEEDDEDPSEGPVPTPTQLATGQQPARTADHLNDTGRTAGIMGGRESGGSPTPGKPAPGDMMADLVAVQKRLQLY